MAKKLALDKEVDIGELIPVSKDSAEYSIFMHVQEFNFERGLIPQERYEQIKKGKLVSQTVGRRNYFFIKDSD